MNYRSTVCHAVLVGVGVKKEASCLPDCCGGGGGGGAAPR